MVDQIGSSIDTSKMTYAEKQFYKNNRERLVSYVTDTYVMPEKTAGDYASEVLCGGAIGGGFMLAQPYLWDGLKYGFSKNYRAASQPLGGFWKGMSGRVGLSNIEGMMADMPKLMLKNKTPRYTGDTKALRDAYRQARQLIKDAKARNLTGQALKDQMKEVEKLIAKGDKELAAGLRSGAIQHSTKMGKYTQLFKNKTGISKLESSLLKSEKGAAALKGASKGLKGCWIFAAIEGALEIPDVISAYKLDSQISAENAKKKESNPNAKLESTNYGNRQLAKSAVKVAASVGGYAAGSALASAAIGATVGSVAPGVGTAIGFVVGLAVGALASWGAGKVMDKVLDEKDSLNKSEVEVYAEKKRDEFASEVSDDDLIAAAGAKAQQDNEVAPETIEAWEALLAQREAEIQTQVEAQRKNDALLYALGAISTRHASFAVPAIGATSIFGNNLF